MKNIIKIINLKKLNVFLFSFICGINIILADENSSNTTSINTTKQLNINKINNDNINNINSYKNKDVDASKNSNTNKDLNKNINKLEAKDTCKTKKNIHHAKKHTHYVKNHNNNEESNISSPQVKTYLYKEDNIYNLHLYSGFQSHIVFGKNEEIKTISMGENYAFKINIIGNRLFVKPIEENIHTNMTVITNKRSYEFDVMVKNTNKHNIPYLIKFVYPTKMQQY